MKAHLLINPKAGMLKECLTPEQVKEKLAGLTLDPVVTIAQDSKGIKEFIEKVKQDTPEYVLIAGGDGTTATIIKGLRDTSVIFGLIPTGSMNNIGQSIGIGDELEDAIEVINKGNVRTMDLGRVNGEVFLESVGIGLVAQIMDKVGEQDSKKEVVRVARHTLKEVVTSESIPVELTVDERKLSIDTVWLTVTNTGRAAAALVDPTSSVHDNKLDIVYCEPLGTHEVAKYALSFIRNSHIREEKFHRLRAKHITMHLPRGVQVHIDGTLQELQTVKIDILPAAIKVLAP